MHVGYEDIIGRISDKPIWWMNGVPRYTPFRPGLVNVYARQAALIHTECQDCGARYDVGIASPSECFRYSLRDTITYFGHLDIGDPPNACSFTNLHSGSTMNSLELAVLEYWERPVVLKGWVRDRSLEWPLADAKVGENLGFDYRPARKLIDEAGLKPEFDQALESNDHEKLVEILTSLGCKRSREIALMLELRQLEKQHWEGVRALAKTRRQRREGG